MKFLFVISLTALKKTGIPHRATAAIVSITLTQSGTKPIRLKTRHTSPPRILIAEFRYGLPESVFRKLGFPCSSAAPSSPSSSAGSSIKDSKSGNDSSSLYAESLIVTLKGASSSDSALGASKVSSVFGESSSAVFSSLVSISISFHHLIKNSGSQSTTAIINYYISKIKLFRRSREHLRAYERP